MKDFLIKVMLIWALGTGIVGAQEICPLNGKPIEPQGLKSVEAIKSLPILHEGRIKPLETFSQNILLQFSGRRTWDRKPAMEWLSRLLFAPEFTRDDMVFLINDPQIPMGMGVTPKTKRRYSFNELEKGYSKLAGLYQAALQIPQKERTSLDHEIIRLHQNLQLYAQLSRSFLFVIPHPDFSVTSEELRQELGLLSNSTQFSYLDIIQRADQIYQISKTLERKPQDQWDSRDQELMTVMMNLYRWGVLYQDIPLAIIPSYVDEEDWMNPWESMASGLNSEEGQKEIKAMADMMAGYWSGDFLKFDMAGRSFSSSILNRIQNRHPNLSQKLFLEKSYNSFPFFLFSRIVYGLAFLLILIALLSEKKIYRTLSFVLVMLGFLPHIFGIILRILILSRPPVSTLYETFIFVALVSVGLGILIERFQRQGLGLIVASFSGFVFLTLAGKFSSDGDTLKMLVAVLNSNFWLSTHVLSITIGYAGCCVAGVVGHVYLIQRWLRPRETQRLATTYRYLMAILGFGLTTTFLGTNLGGIWADQSWGRFWGWDPKENGALLIILWTAMIFHARVGKFIGPVGVAVGSVLGMLVVMWAWFGVNLLSVGLHSYGFTEGAVLGLGIYVTAELIFLGTLLWILRRAMATAVERNR
ncbi:MAG: cytochrome c biogenesis protein CcsA [Candidatus Omnitrophica bacterium]|nr:cytochrome c biogenesis protein CcsA [Candidatus Omnitrophota bacterium]